MACLEVDTNTELEDEVASLPSPDPIMPLSLQETFTSNHEAVPSLPPPSIPPPPPPPLSPICTSNLRSEVVSGFSYSRPFTPPSTINTSDSGQGGLQSPPSTPYLPSPTTILWSLPIMEEDISAMSSPSGWWTDSCLRAIILHERLDPGFEDIYFVEPGWFSDFSRRVLENYEKSSTDASTHESRHYEIPHFLDKKEIKYLVMPYNLGNDHWTILFVDLEGCRVIFYNSHLTEADIGKAKSFMQEFFKAYRSFFGDGEEKTITFLVGECHQQDDISSCGIYACLNALCLLQSIWPEDSGVGALSKEDKCERRAEGVRILEELRNEQISRLCWADF